jgi:hypothetical protein
MLNSCSLQEFSGKWIFIFFRGYVCFSKLGRHNMMACLHILAEKLWSAQKKIIKEKANQLHGQLDHLTLVSWVSYSGVA